MLKFRSTMVDAETLLADLTQLERASDSLAILKMKEGPRAPGAIAFMRRFGLDEHPLLFNVIGVSTSLVNSRPPLASVVRQHTNPVHLRFLPKLGTGDLWQVSGIATLSREETIRLDPSHVENGSRLGDVRIRLRTAQAVVVQDLNAR